MQRTLLSVNFVALILSSLYLWSALDYPRGTMGQPGPGLYPLGVGVFLVIASIGSIVANLLKPDRGKMEIAKGKDLGRMLTVLGAGVTYVLLLPYAGHVLSSILLVFLVLHAMRLRSWPMKIGFTILMALGSYYVFDVLLMVPLPRGFWG
jgi:putative tricarboxylic transport membrane protein